MGVELRIGYKRGTHSGIKGLIMVQYADNHGDNRISKVLCLSPNEDSAFASLMYMIAGGEIDTGNLPPNHKEALFDMYAKVYRGGHRIDGD